MFAKESNCRDFSLLIAWSLAYVTTLAPSVCVAKEIQTESEYKIPAAPVVLLLSEAKKQRKGIWNKEVRSVSDIENTLRDYLKGILHDLHAHREKFSPSTQHWLRKLLEVHQLDTGNKKQRGSLASTRTLAPRSLLIKFAGEKAIQKIDDCMDGIPPPLQQEHDFPFFEKHGDPPPKIPIG